jgi:hypothetical protein
VFVSLFLHVQQKACVTIPLWDGFFLWKQRKDGLGANKAWREMMMIMGDAAACGYWGFRRHWRWMQESWALPVHTTPHQRIRSCWLLHVCSSSVLLSWPSQMHFLFNEMILLLLWSYRFFSPISSAFFFPKISAKPFFQSI